MKRKFSTLAAFFMAVGTFLSTANAQVGTIVGANEFKSGNIYYIANGTTGSEFAMGVNEATGTFTVENKAANAADLTTNQQWHVYEVQDPANPTDELKVVYVFENVANGYTLKFDAAGAIKLTAGEGFTQFKFASNAKYTGALAALSLQETIAGKVELKLEAAATTLDATGSGTDIALYSVPATDLTTKELNELGFGDGFQLVFKKANGKDNLSVEANPFTSNTISAIPAGASANAATAKSFYLKVEGDFAGIAGTGGNATEKEIEAFRNSSFIVVDTLSRSSINTTIGYDYKIVSGAEMLDEDGYAYSATAAAVQGFSGKKSSDIARRLENSVFSVSTDVNAPKVLRLAATTAVVPVKNNGKGLEGHTTAGLGGNNLVTIYDFDGVYYVATGNANDTRLVVGSDNQVKQTQLVGYVNITSLDNTTKTYGKVFGPKITSNLASYTENYVVNKDKPEGQFVVTSTADGVFTFKNRENTSASYVTTNLYKISGDTYVNLKSGNADTLKIEAAVVGDMYYGYLDASKTLDLEKKAFNISVYSAVTNNVFLTEQHVKDHLVGLSEDVEDAAAWRLVKFDGKKDSIIITQSLSYVKDDAYKADKKDKIVMFTYALYNEATNEFVSYDANKKAYYCDPAKKVNELDSAKVRDDVSIAKFVIKDMGNDCYNLVEVTQTAGKNGAFTIAAANNKLYGAFTQNKVNKNTTGMYDLTDNDLFVIEEVAAPFYREVATYDTVSIYKNGNENIRLYERGHFLGMQHTADITKMNSAIFVDTAFVTGTNRPQYLLAVRPTLIPHKDDCGIPGHETIVTNEMDTVYGSFLINMVDSAKAYGLSEHTNPYIWENTSSYKLSFLDGYHTGNELGIYLTADHKKVAKIDLSKNVDVIGAYAFRYVDREEGSFTIETSYNGKDRGYIKWLNGTPAVVSEPTQAEVFNMNIEETNKPTANDAISASEVSVVATNGAVIIKGAEGKNVVITNVLGQTIANTAISSSEATIAAPAGVVVVAVEGEAAVKAIVK